MSWRRSSALISHELRVMFADPGTLLFLVLMPFLMMWVMKPLFQLSLQAEGFVGASGAEQAVPGIAAMFATFSASFAGFTFFREHGWNTWERLRASRASTADIMVGKMFPTLLVAVLQMLVLFVLGALMLDLTIAGSITGLAALVVVFSIAMLAFGMAITAISRTSQQLNSFVNVGGILFAAIGGALVPISVLPGWVQSIAVIIPTYWAMNGFRDVILEGAGVFDVVGPVVVLILFAAAFTLIAALRFRVEESKIYYG
ncbi:MAG: ABC transporter permease [Acidimicrobiia bacterium]